MVGVTADPNQFAHRATGLDAADPLSRFRDEFVLPPGRIYLDGNSLGLLSRRAQDAAISVIAQWGALGIDGWMSADPPWTTLADRTAARLARFVGGSARETAVTGGTTANLHQLLATLFRPHAEGPNTIVGISTNFPSDNYALASHLQMRGLEPEDALRLVLPRKDRLVATSDIIAAFTPDVQLAVLPSVLFTTGQLLDVVGITREAHARGILIGWDLAHSIGAVPHALGSNDGPDFAFWCSYKWLNAGPGAAGGLFLHRRHHPIRPGMAGWWGMRADRRFSMAATHEPEEGASSLHIGTPAILSIAPLEGALAMIADAGGVEPLREKSLAQTNLIIEIAESFPENLRIEVVSPLDAASRGGHVALSHPEAWRVCQALKAVGVTPDFRPPDIIRLAPSPLYTSFAEIVDAMALLRQVIETGAYESFPNAAAQVT